MTRTSPLILLTLAALLLSGNKGMAGPAIALEEREGKAIIHLHDAAASYGQFCQLAQRGLRKGRSLWLASEGQLLDLNSHGVEWHLHSKVLTPEAEARPPVKQARQSVTIGGGRCEYLFWLIEEHRPDDLAAFQAALKATEGQHIYLGLSLRKEAPMQVLLRYLATARAERTLRGLLLGIDEPPSQDPPSIIPAEP